jgi:tetratricopeptide (TPR) repeat protein
MRKITILSALMLLISQMLSQGEPHLIAVSDADVKKSPEFKAVEAAESGTTKLPKAKILVQKFPNSALAHMTVCDAYFSLGFIDEAAVFGQKAVELNPANPIIWIKLGNVREEQQKFDEAEAAFKMAVSVSARTDAFAWTVLARFYGDHKKVEFALHCANTASKHLKVYPFNNHYKLAPEELAWRNLAKAFKAIDQPAKAVPCLRKAITINPTDAKVWVELSEVYEEMGDRSQAAVAAERSVKLDPDNEDAKLLLEELTEPKERSFTLEQLSQTMDVIAKLRQLTDPYAPEFLTTVEQLQKVQAEPPRGRQKQTPEEANAWWQEYQLQQKISQMQAEIDRLKSQTK